MFYLSLRNLIIGYSLERRINMIVKKSERERYENVSVYIVHTDLFEIQNNTK